MSRKLPDSAPSNERYSVNRSRLFHNFITENKISFALSTYQSGKLFLIGRANDQHLSIFERSVRRCMGLWSDGQSLVLTSAYEIWRCRNVLPAGRLAEGHDRLFSPRVAYVTGDVDLHDVALDQHGNIIFVNTLYSCLATVSQRYSFIPFWKPPFISKYSAEDRCHLNGLAMENGMPRYVTCCGQSDAVDGWRDSNIGGGCVVDVASNEVVLRGLTMPHSPRVYNGVLWLLDSGTGYFGYVDPQTGKFENVTFCPGYARGLAFVGNYALVGLSKDRKGQNFASLPLGKNLTSRNATPRCGVIVIDMRTGDTVQWLWFEGSVIELYDVCTIPGVIRPKAISLFASEIRNTIALPDGSLVDVTPKDTAAPANSDADKQFNLGEDGVSDPIAPERDE